jgi:uncharacterized SAM-binding protein YcdF (DUF218 family)
MLLSSPTFLLRLRRRVPASIHRWLSGWRPFVLGVIAGIALVLGGYWFIDNTRVADHLVAPLLESDTSGVGDAIVVLGAAVNERCSPNIYGIRRTMFARDAFLAGRAPRLLITGGRAVGAPCAVSEAMRTLLVQLGVPADRIIVESSARSTWDNARFSDPILRALGAKRLVLVTDILHMRRAEACFRAFGYHVERLSVPVSESHPDNVSMLAMGLRETIAYGYYHFRGRFNSHHVETPASRSPAGTSDQAFRPSPSPMSATHATSQRPDPPAGYEAIRRVAVPALSAHLTRP